MNFIQLCPYNLKSHLIALQDDDTHFVIIITIVKSVDIFPIALQLWNKWWSLGWSDDFTKWFHLSGQKIDMDKWQQSQNSTPQKRSRKLLSLRNCWFSHKIILHLKMTQGDKKVGLTRLERNYDLQSGHTTPFTIHNYVSTQRKLKWWLMLFSIEPSIKLKSIFQVLVLWWQAKNKHCSFLFSFGFAFGSLEKNAV